MRYGRSNLRGVEVSTIQNCFIVTIRWSSDTNFSLPAIMPPSVNGKRIRGIATDCIWLTCCTIHGLRIVWGIGELSW